MKTLRILLTALLLVTPVLLAMEAPLPRPAPVPVTEEVFTLDAFRAYLFSSNVKHPDIVLAQARLETADFTSTIFLENHNLFGMKYVDTCFLKQVGARYRPTLAIREQYGHAYYLDWRQSVDDYLLWQGMFKRTNLDVESAYVAVLARVYCPDRAGRFNHAYVRAVHRLKTKTTCAGDNPGSSGS